MDENGWSSPIPYDLERSILRASVPKQFAVLVPEFPGVYVVLDQSQRSFCEAIQNIGHDGPRANSKPHGLRGRLATTVTHSSSNRIAKDILEGIASASLSIIWHCFDTKAEAALTEGALLELYRREFGRLPKYNSQSEYYENIPIYYQFYINLKGRFAASQKENAGIR